MKRQTASAVDSRLAKALAHPLRVQLLAALNEGVASPNELAKRLDEPLTNVSYHVRMLHDLGTIELVETEPRRGALEHYYRAVVRPFFGDRDWKRLPKNARGRSRTPSCSSYGMTPPRRSRRPLRRARHQAPEPQRARRRRGGLGGAERPPGRDARPRCRSRPTRLAGVQGRWRHVQREPRDDDPPDAHLRQSTAPSSGTRRKRTASKRTAAKA